MYHFIHLNVINSQKLNKSSSLNNLNEIARIVEFMSVFTNQMIIYKIGVKIAHEKQCITAGRMQLNDIVLCNCFFRITEINHNLQ